MAISILFIALMRAVCIQAAALAMPDLSLMKRKETLSWLTGGISR